MVSIVADIPVGYGKTNHPHLIVFTFEEFHPPWNWESESTEKGWNFRWKTGGVEEGWELLGKTEGCPCKSVVLKTMSMSGLKRRAPKGAG